jgi:hypothetical protein
MALSSGYGAVPTQEAKKLKSFKGFRLARYCSFSPPHFAKIIQNCECYRVTKFLFARGKKKQK